MARSLTFTSAGWSTDIWDFSGDTPTLKNVGLVKENVSTKTLEKPISVTAQVGATSNFESLVGFKTITLTGGVTGLTRETIGLTAGSFTIAQDGANAFTFEVKATDTVGDVIDRINAGGIYNASLDDEGRFVISVTGKVAEIKLNEDVTYDTILIYTVEDLQKIKNNLSGHYKLMADLDLTGIDWTPIGTSSDKFTGSFDGNNYTIKNLTIDSAESDNIGLFGYAEDAKFQNIVMENVSVKGNNYVGALVGYVTGDSDLKNIEIKSGNVEGIYSVGMIAGQGYYLQGDVNNLFTSGTVNGEVNVGGIFGYFYGYSNFLDMETSSSSATVNGKDNVGGLVGYGYNCRIEDSAFKGEVTGTNKVGGILGYVENMYSGFSRTYSTGTVNGEKMLAV